MIHLGDITQIHGDEIPVVDIIAGGSPCQDLSVAGKRAGLDGERSGLFMEQIRIVKEMRERDLRTGRTGWLVRPRFMVWENVPGAFSSNKGRDFQAVLSEIVKIAEPDAPNVPMPENGKWPKAGCLYSDMGGWSVAWRVHDAQFWGVPQRRKRIALVADFGGLAAPEVLFERQGLSWDSGKSEAAWEGAAGAVENGTGSTEPIPIHDQATRFKGKHGEKTDGKGNGLGVGHPGDPSHTLSAGDYHAVFSVGVNGDIAGTLDANYYKGCGERQGVEREVVCVGNGQLNQMSMAEQANTLDTMHDQQAVMVTAVDCRNGTENPGVNGTLQAKSNGGFSYNCQTVCRTNQTVRRLTPLECERLQGFPDGWTDIGEWTDSKGKKHKDADSPRYKALGNSIALPFWQWMARRICAQYERTPTMGSLFDGIGGFPLVFQRSGAVPVWASEIEEFPIAVTKYHFKEE